MAAEINTALDAYFPIDLDGEKLRIIAEPGRYYACSAFTLSVKVISKRVIPPIDESKSKSIMYYINDGVYGSFSNAIHEKTKFVPIVVENHSSDVHVNSEREMYESKIWGPTCDSIDLVLDECRLPELSNEATLVFKDMGAYSLSIACSFNGMSLPRCIYVVSNSFWQIVKNAFVF